MSHHFEPVPSTLRRAVRGAAFAALLGSALCASGSAQTSVGTDGAGVQAAKRDASLGQLLRNADLVFEGTVVQVRHRNSNVRNAGEVSLPHTFVTFQVERLYKGGVAGSTNGTLTLRFLGGPDGTGGVLRVSHAPEFELGSREILLVQNSETWGIPLVNGKERRFRIVEDRVLSESGRALEFVEGGVRVRPSDKANESQEQAGVSPAQSLKGDVFRTTLERMIRSNHTVEQFFATPAVASVVFDRPFFLPVAAPQAPVVRAADLAAPVDQESDR